MIDQQFPTIKKVEFYLFLILISLIFVFYLVVKITLISSNDKHLIKCKEDILNLARSFSTKSETTKQDMLDWSQNTIYRYYAYCLKQRVIPTLDLAKTTLELTGPKDAVMFLDFFYQVFNLIDSFRYMMLKNIFMN